MRNEKFDSIVLIILLLVTAFVLYLHHNVLNKSFLITPTSDIPMRAVTDAGIGGKSKAQLILTDDYMLLDCEIIKSDYPWPFCEITMDLGITQPEPMDLSRFTHVDIAAKYIGDNSAGLRFQLRSLTPGISSKEDDGSWKYNGLEYWPENNDYPVTVPMNGLQVATWWLLEREVPIEHIGPDLTQVMVLELATGNNIPPGKYQIKVEKIEFKGKMFTNRQLYFTVILLWGITGIAGIIVNFRRYKNRLQKAVDRAEELRQLNRLLNVESKELKNLAERDQLTGALNRVGCEHIFSNEFKILSLIFIDIDHFKPLNDKYGHNVGDDVLKEFAKVISENCRSTDFLARWGGEEFILICPNTKLHEAYDLAEALRYLLEEHRWTHGIKLTASFGVAQKDNETRTDFIARADKALYAAKARGRNTVVVSDNLNRL